MTGVLGPAASRAASTPPGVTSENPAPSVSSMNAVTAGSTRS